MEEQEKIGAALVSGQQQTLNVEGLELHQAAEQPKAQKKEAVSDDGIGGYEDIRIEETQYLYFPWFIRGKLTAVQGDSDTGKSTLLYCIGAYVTNGREIFGIPCESPGNVMYITLEDSESDILTAFTDSGGDVRKLKRIKDRKRIAKLSLGNAADLRFIEDAIRKHQLSFLVFDPIQAFLSGDINKANETRPQMEALAEIAENTGCAIVFIQHQGKDTARQGIHRGLGSVDIVAASRSLLQVSVDPEDESLVLCFTVKNNTAARQDTQRAITYRILDHPDSFDRSTGKHHHFHGHAELCGTISKYNERIHRDRVLKFGSGETRIEYASDPLVLTIRELARENPDGLYIWNDELIQRITDSCGKCPYTATNDQRTGLNSRLREIRGMMMERDRIQVDIVTQTRSHKPYLWRGQIVADSDKSKSRGINITIVKREEETDQGTSVPCI